MKRVENPRKLKTMIKWYVNDYADISKACDYFLSVTSIKIYYKFSWILWVWISYTYTYSEVLKINEKLNIMRL